MKKAILSMMAVAALSMTAQQRVMNIYLSNGDVETIPVSDVLKISFGLSGEEPDPEGGVTMVDMGLSVKWASANVGATKPSDYGNFYAYGEIEPKDVYSWDTYQWRYPDYNDWDCDEWEKYYKLGATFTGTNYDVAHVKWGEQWRTPTKAEWDELIYNCTWQWGAQGSVAGMIATSKVNGNSIFLPAAGNMVDGEHTHDQLGCFYWTSSEYEQPDITQECRNYRANLDATNQSAKGYDYPEVGLSVRAVYDPVPAEKLPSVVKPGADDMVDLGLSVKWAAFNLGASKPGSDGLFFCWGELSEKQYSHTYNYKYYDPLTDDVVDIGSNICGTEYDAAHVLWGDGWRMPTAAEIQELIEQCTWEASSSGYTVTGPNGNSIFLKASGFMTYKGKPRSSNESGLYFSGEVDGRVNSQGQAMTSQAQALRFTRSGYSLNTPQLSTFSRAGGIQIRPVHE